VTQSPKNRPVWLPKVLAGIFGIGMALGMIAFLLALFPRFNPNNITFTVGMGDILFYQTAWMPPLDNKNEVLSVHPIAWDVEGFRVPHRRAESYPIVALGDSFTESANAAAPWPDVLAEALNIPVRNLGFRGFGPLDESEAFKRYAADDDSAQTIIIGFFEGNDMSNAVTFQERGFIPPADTEDFNLIQVDDESVTERDIRYPMQVDLNGTQHDIVFLEGYVWQLNGLFGAYERSLNLDLTAQSWKDIRAAAPEACIIVAYFPDKSHVYLPFLTEENRPILMQKVMRTVAGGGRALNSREATDEDRLFDTLLARLSNQRDAVAARAAAEGFPFFDTTPILRDAASQGQMLYYTYDTHWNQDGHNRVGTALAEYLRVNPCDVSSGS
jgi:lysophospholipase L1-like esterase